MKIDAVIVDLELQLETANNPWGSFVIFRFIDVYPNFTKVNETIKQIEKRGDVLLVDYNYTYTGIHEDTDISHLTITKH